MTAPDCRDPARCPVPDLDADVIGDVRYADLPADVSLQRSYLLSRGAESFNASGLGNTRFAPLADAVGNPVGHLYAARRRTVALLESVFHNVHEAQARVIYAATDLVGRGLASVQWRQPVSLVDLRDNELERLGLDREGLVATAAAHYPCTRQWAAALRNVNVNVSGTVPSGLLWRSRVAELAQHDSMLLDDLFHGDAAEACVLWDDRLSADTVVQVGANFDDLLAGPGRLLVEEVASTLGAETH